MYMPLFAKYFIFVITFAYYDAILHLEPLTYHPHCMNFS